MKCSDCKKQIAARPIYRWHYWADMILPFCVECGKFFGMQRKWLLEKELPQ